MLKIDGGNGMKYKKVYQSGNDFFILLLLDMGCRPQADGSEQHGRTENRDINDVPHEAPVILRHWWRKNTRK